MMEHLVPPSPEGGKVLPFDVSKVDRGITELRGVPQIFRKLPPRRTLVKALGMMPGAPCILFGEGGSRKTMIAQSLALSVAIGAPIWGMFSVPQGRVVHLDWEQGEWLTDQRYQRLAAGMGIGPNDIGDNLFTASYPRFTFDQKGWLDEIARLCEGASLLLIDSLRVAAGATWDENASKARDPLDQLGRLSEAHGWSVLLLHHANKGGDDDPERNRMRGSGGIRDACESQLYASAKKGEPTLIRQLKSRSGPESETDLHVRVDDDPELATVEDADGNLYPALLVRASLAVDDKAREKKAEKSDLKRRVLDFLLKNPGCTGNYVVENVVGKTQAIRAMLETLEREGLAASKKPEKGERGGIRWTPKTAPDRRTGEREEDDN